MTTTRKLHELQGAISLCLPGQVSSGPHKNQPFYYLEISPQSLFANCNEALSMSGRHNCEVELKRQQYREFHQKNPLPLEHGIEMKECEGCYCQMFCDGAYDFCSGCLGRDGKIKKGSHRGQEKKLSFTQKQRLHLEQIIQQVQDMIVEIKEEEDPDY
ncbi:9598_t:CDS:2 [Cetraspora pellucida]|uniref:9598_t:CDS:1 n=1 Tax=Cetraspora pellucida TaxID=1433469 RepID=A0ACA9LYA3_9GLOM|nr:9598_t:CDS:2 [Cetraspora pellucida]